MAKRERRKVTNKEATDLVLKSWDIHAFSSAGRALSHRASSKDPMKGDEAFFGDALKDILDTAFPTYLIIKMAAISEQYLDTLWKLRFPTIATRRLSYEEKLKTLSRHKPLDVQGLTSLWALRNSLAHEPQKIATWKDCDRYNELVYQFINELNPDRRTKHKIYGLSLGHRVIKHEEQNPKVGKR
jgi:hypothetical protein